MHASSGQERCSWEGSDSLVQLCTFGHWRQISCLRRLLIGPENSHCSQTGLHQFVRHCRPLVHRSILAVKLSRSMFSSWLRGARSFISLVSCLCVLFFVCGNGFSSVAACALVSIIPFTSGAFQNTNELYICTHTQYLFQVPCKKMMCV